MNYAGLNTPMAGMVFLTLGIENLMFTRCPVQPRCSDNYMTIFIPAYGTSVTKLKVEDNLRVLETLGEVETFEVSDMVGQKSVVADLDILFKGRHSFGSELFASVTCRTEKAALHRLYKVVQRKLFNEYMNIRKKKNVKNR